MFQNVLSSFIEYSPFGIIILLSSSKILDFLYSIVFPLPIPLSLSLDNDGITKIGG